MKTFHTVSGNTQLERNSISENFADLHPRFDNTQALVESSRCLYCFDAPCTNACPTSIDIPKFIRQIHGGDPADAAKTILSENILGGTCARACPTEILCEQACVVNQTEGAPVKIGELQRYAVDDLLDTAQSHPFERQRETGVRFAVIGGGPAGLAFAHRFAMLGNSVSIFDKEPKMGGLNEYGLAAYKMADDFAQREVAFLLDIGGIDIRAGLALGIDFSIDELLEQFDGIFVGVGLDDARQADIPGADLSGICNAIDFIHDLRQASDKSNVKISKDVVVIGGGNTAIDAAVQARCLGAENVSLVYRRGPDQMSATEWEQNLAAINGVKIYHWMSPSHFTGQDGVQSAVFDTVSPTKGKLTLTGEKVELSADTVLLAVGQELSTIGLETLDTSNGKLVVNEQYQTSNPRIYAGGDCIATGEDLTVQAVEDGKQAAMRAHAIILQQNAAAAE